MKHLHLAIFDPAKIQDHVTFKNSIDTARVWCIVFVNGIQVLEDGEHNRSKPGGVVRGPEWKK